MGTIFRKELKRTRRGLIIWCAIVGLVSYMGILEYPVIGQYTDVIASSLDLMPKLGQIVFGVYEANLSDPIGYYIVMYYWTGLIVFVHAIYTGGSIISKESRDKTAEYLFTKPYTRNTIVLAKMLAGLANITIVGLLTMVMSMLAMIPISSESLLYRQIFISCVGMFITQIVMMMLGLLCSAIFKNYRFGMMASMIVLVVSYCMMFFIQYIDASELYFLSPLTLFSAYEVVNDGLALPNLLLSIGTTVLCFYLVRKLYSKKPSVI